MAYAQLRVEERTRAYVIASGANVALTVTLTIALVVFAGEGARGLLLGNFGASALVVLGLWFVLGAGLGGARRRVSLRVRGDDLAAMLRFGLPTVPADAAVYALQVVDRFYLFQGLLAHLGGSVRGRDQARDRGVRRRARLPVRVAAAGVLDRERRGGRAAVLAGDDLLRVRHRDRRVRGHAARALDGAAVRRGASTIGAYRALPWLALGWALYGLFLVLAVVAGRARVTTRNLPAAAVGLAVNAALLVARPGVGRGSASPARHRGLRGLRRDGLTAMYLLTRRLFHVGFEWGRLAHLVSYRRPAGRRRAAAAHRGRGGLSPHPRWYSRLPCCAPPASCTATSSRGSAPWRRRCVRARAGAARAGAVEAYAEDPLRDL